MPVCLICGWEIIIGPAGCACTQKNRRERELEEREKYIERLKKLIPPKQEEPKSLNKKLSKLRKKK